jgi:hypothetical protein
MASSDGSMNICHNLIAADIPMTFRQRSIFYYNLALSKYRQNEIQASRLDLEHIICHRHPIMKQALALEKLELVLGLDICCLSLELSLQLHDQNALDAMEFYYLTHLKSLKLLSEKEVIKIEAIMSLYKLALGRDVGHVSFGHLMELWKFESFRVDVNDAARLQIKNLNNVGCLLGQTNFLHASINHFERALLNPSISSSERDIILHNKAIVDRK